MFTEPVLIEVPDHPALSATVPVMPDDTDRAVALRLAPAWPPGTVLTIADSKWVVGRQQPPSVSPVEVGATGCPPTETRPSEASLEPRQRKASGSRLKAVGDAAVPDRDKALRGSFLGPWVCITGMETTHSEMKETVLRIAAALSRSPEGIEIATSLDGGEWIWDIRLAASGKARRIEGYGTTLAAAEAEVLRQSR